MRLSESLSSTGHSLSLDFGSWVLERADDKRMSHKQLLVGDVIDQG